MRTLLVVVVCVLGSTGAVHAAPCELATPKACYERGVELFKAQDAAAADMFERACESGVAEGCTELGFILMEGMLVRRDDARSLKASLRACELGSGLGCNNAFVMVRDNRGTKRDDVELRRLALASCAANDGEGCYLLAAVYGEPLGGPEDAKGAGEALDKSCKLEFGMACAVVAHRTLEGTYGYRQDEVRGVQLMAKACSFGSPEACVLVADWSLAGERGLKQSRDKALELYKVGCDLGLDEGCDKHKRLDGQMAAGSLRGKLARRSSKRIMMTFDDGDIPTVGAVGEISKATKVMGADMSVVIGKVVVKKVDAKSVELELLEEVSTVVIDGKKVDHWKPGAALTLAWKRAP